jgi:hypothetical protein
MLEQFVHPLVTGRFRLLSQKGKTEVGQEWIQVKANALTVEEETVKLDDEDVQSIKEE